MNPMVDLLAAKKPLFGLYAPSARDLPDAPPPAPRGGAGGGRGGAATGPRPQEDPCGDAAELKAKPAVIPVMTAKEIEQQTALAKLALSNHTMDYLFGGGFEGGVDTPNLPTFTEFVKALAANGLVDKSPTPHLVHPIVQKAPKVGCDLKMAISNISRELNLGMTGLMFPHTASAQELEAGLKAMRFKSKGGTRPDDAGIAPQIWGLTPAQYKEKADLSSLNPAGELTNFTIIEDKDGLAHRREIAAVKGIGVLWPGAGTLGGVFQKQKPDGTWGRDDVAWEEAIQQVLAACKEFNVPCGYPANSVADMEMRSKQGFSVFVSSWGKAGLDTVDAGRKAAGRPATDQ